MYASSAGGVMCGSGRVVQAPRVMRDSGMTLATLGQGGRCARSCPTLNCCDRAEEREGRYALSAFRASIGTGLSAFARASRIAFSGIPAAASDLRIWLYACAVCFEVNLIFAPAAVSVAASLAPLVRRLAIVAPSCGSRLRAVCCWSVTEAESLAVAAADSRPTVVSSAAATLDTFWVCAR